MKCSARPACPSKFGYARAWKPIKGLVSGYTTYKGSDTNQMKIGFKAQSFMATVLEREIDGIAGTEYTPGLRWLELLSSWAAMACFINCSWSWPAGCG